MRALVAIALAVPALAHADDEIVKGSIVKIEAQEIYVDIGAQKGVAHGASVRIKRAVSLRHPVTRALVQDWLPVGSASVTQAGTVMSRAVLGDLVTQVKLGDVVEILVDRPDVAPKPDRPAPPPPQGPPVDPQTAEVLGVFAA